MKTIPLLTTIPTSSGTYGEDGEMVDVVGWMLAILLFILVRFFGLESVEAFRDFDFTRLDRTYLVSIGLVAGAVLGLAFGSLDHLVGQVIGKSWMVVVAIPFIVWIRKRDERLGIEPA